MISRMSTLPSESDVINGFDEFNGFNALNDFNDFSAFNWTKKRIKS